MSRTDKQFELERYVANKMTLLMSVEEAYDVVVGTIEDNGFEIDDFFEYYDIDDLKTIASSILDLLEDRIQFDSVTIRAQLSPINVESTQHCCFAYLQVVSGSVTVVEADGSSTLYDKPGRYPVSCLQGFSHRVTSCIFLEVGMVRGPGALVRMAWVDEFAKLPADASHRRFGILDAPSHPISTAFNQLKKLEKENATQQVGCPYAVW